MPSPQRKAWPDPSLAARFQQALALQQSGALAEAGGLCRDLLAAAPAFTPAQLLLGMLECQQGRADEGVRWVRKVLRAEPANAHAHAVLGNAWAQLDRHADALASFDRALALDPQAPVTHFNRGNTLGALGRLAEAAESYRRALALQPDFAEAHYNLGNACLQLNRPADALASFERVLARHPDAADVLVNHGAALARLRRHAEALGSYDRALRAAPGDPQALINRADALAHLGRSEDAVACCDQLLAHAPDHREALYVRATALRDLKRYADAAQGFAALLAHAPDYPFAKGELLHCRMLACDWDGLDDLVRAVEADVRAGRRAIAPFGYQAVATRLEDLKRCAEIHAAEHYPAVDASPATAAPAAGAKIRLGYVSGEFRQQATAMLITELLERHDRGRFELYAFDNGGDDGGELRARITRACREVVDIRALTDAEAAAAVRARGIDILVSLNGYFGLDRQGVFALRAAPVQVNYLGFPGTLGAPYMDYIIADRHVLPPGEERGYTERVVRLPDSYQPNDTQRRIAPDTPSRAAAGLPAAGFVFCCFNNNYKLTPAVFAVWMRLLARVEGSVLWLLEDNPEVPRNLRREAERHGVAPARLVFAPRVPADEHLARHRLADLFLDTLPYNAHTTASDALWAGLPLLTCRGGTFPGRVAASLLTAAGLPELITDSLADYEALALRLATQPAALAALRERLRRQRDACALFDTDRYRRHLEAAYAEMHARRLRGAPPLHIEVPAETELGMTALSAAAAG